MLRIKYLLLSIILVSVVQAQDTYKFRIILKDKGVTGYSLDKPEQFLSQKAIERRIRQNIIIDSTDLPISARYITEIEELGCVVIAKSKWLSSVTVHCTDSNVVRYIESKDFVENAVFVWKGQGALKKDNKNNDIRSLKEDLNSSDYYGLAYNNIAMHRGDSLHNAGYRGEGMEIAVLDAGFENIENNLMLSDIMVKGMKDFVYNDGSHYPIYSSHGINVLSCMATNQPNIYVGTAPKAKYWLLRTEDPASEFPVEEDYWVAAAEYADSLGVDLINSSLGYSSFNRPAEDFTYEQMDGKTTFISRGATMAASKGIFVVCSAGNEGFKAWRHITAPADSEQVFTIGAVRVDSVLASFSSRGPSADLRIKPDVVGLGERTRIIHPYGEIVEGNGTSFSGPIVCGLIACLWQANPGLNVPQLADIVRKSANRFENPDNNYGYGIPDMVLAMDLARNYTGMSSNTVEDGFSIISDSTGNMIIKKDKEDGIKYYVTVYSVDGKLVLSDSFTGQEKLFRLQANDKRVYIVNVKCREFTMSKKVCL